MGGDCTIRLMRAGQEPLAAGLHIKYIPAGFLSSLGVDVLTVLYRAVGEHKQSFCLVAEQGGQVVGFLAITSDIKALYRYAVLHSGLKLISLLWKRFFSVRTVKKMLETVFYPFRKKSLKLPSAELLAVVVDESVRGRGIATKLIYEGFKNCKAYKIERIKVMVASDNEAANGLYKKCGFELVTTINSHNVPSNIYVANVGG